MRRSKSGENQKCQKKQLQHLVLEEIKLQKVGNTILLYKILNLNSCSLPVTLRCAETFLVGNSTVPLDF